jgi:cytoskeleton protein RodZ
MTKGTFGENLKREREMRGVTLEEISLATRIATRFLRAIESEEWDHLPGGVFNRGFVRSFARYLGLDEENTVAEYTLAAGDRPSVPVWTGSPPVVIPERHPVAWILAAIFVLALLAGAWFGTRRFLAWRAAKRTAQAAEMNSPSSPMSSSTPTQQNASDPAAASNNGAPAPSDQDATSGGRAVASVSLSTTAPASEPFELKIEADKKTKVTVVADKDVVFDGTIKAGENHSFAATDHFQVSAKDAGALRLALNGKAIAPIGPAGHAGKVTLTRDALKAPAGGGN